MKADRDQISRLLKTAKGQLDGISRMVEEDRYCIDISNQILATQSILRRIHREILRGHLGCCVREAMESGGEKEQQEKIEELLSVFDKLSM